MSLKSFHLFFITLCAALALFLTLWGLQEYRLTEELGDLWLAGVGGALFLLLIPYLRWFRKKWAKLQLVALGIIAPCAGWDRMAEACSVCFGDPNSPLTHGARWGVFTLVVIVTGVLAAIALIAYRWNQRAKQLG